MSQLQLEVMFDTMTGSTTEAPATTTTKLFFGLAFEHQHYLDTVRI